MGELIDLVDGTFPDCDTCKEPTKRKTATTFDVDGPGVVGALYHCENRQCRALQYAMVRAWEGENRIKKENGR